MNSRFFYGSFFTEEYENTYHLLTDNFYNDYTATAYPEILQKQDRPYLVFLVKIHSNTFAIPFRTHIPHNNCYKFRDSGRTTEGNSGLDYSKAVIITKSSYIGEAVKVDNQEYLNVANHYYFIQKQFKKYVDKYIFYVTNNMQNDIKFINKYKYCTLKYFHQQLNLTTN